jgi:hypothetical protein
MKEMTLKEFEEKESKLPRFQRLTPTMKKNLLNGGGTTIWFGEQIKVILP